MVTSSSASTITSSSSSSGDGSNCQQTPAFNPHFLGREFVRQYYTVLNEGPHIMHRFYSDDSSLIHGGSNKQGESTVYGQAEINNKIMSLNFKDCHTKIRQVDSMETVGKGVVIQVIGELSNNGEPMRRFFQTFVLAPRSPSNYYVRNDIFRYQDEVFVDDEEYNEIEKNEEIEKAENEVKTPVNEKAETIVPPLSMKENVYETVNVNGNLSHNEISDVEKTAESDVEVNTKPEHTTFAVNNEWESNSVRREEGTNEVNAISDGNSSPPAQNFTQNQNEPMSYASMVNKNPVFYNTPPFSNAPTNFVAKSSDTGILNAPFTKAAIVENSTTPTTTASVAPSTVSTVSGGNQKPPVSTHPREQKVGRARGHQGLKQRNDSREVTPGFCDSDSNAGETNEFVREPRRQQFSDDQQVFVGNLQQDITEEQLKTFFGKFGTIIDVRINRQNQKSGRTPNYGFVTFDDPSIVKDILSKKPIYFNDHRFNVEEKRSQTRSERPGRETSRSGSGGGGGHVGSNLGRVVNNSLANSGNRIQSGSGSGQRRDRGERGNQSFGGSDSGRRNGGGGGGGGGPRSGSTYVRR
ncbi:ras GTPase-activating protein-binding-like protein [Dinothrombium tinctorium]|uniref:Ras GTPase-activating protein-binding-like protein n=1 Tax=Dinothrombium tinctorium TaxID=1965070 RepID=A0A3S3SHW5_9ACAR|nr:ras GTPase-activating protein-binding-like protein [Dinothrombium tinctorium]